jgi:nitrite reductase (NO-forming)
MKNNNILKSILILAALIISQQVLYACPRCNLAFYNELLEQRGKTLGGQELLAAIMNQGIDPKQFAASLESPVNPPVSPVTNTVTNLITNSSNTVTNSVTKPSSLFQTTPGSGDFIEIINRDNSLGIPPTSYVPQDAAPNAKVQIELSEGEHYIGKGVMFKGFLTNGTIPGPTIIVNEGDIVEFTIVNKGNIPHGGSIHSAYTQTSKYIGNIAPGETKKVLFRVTQPGVFMYHCAPGGHAIPMHVLFGQYGMMVVKPKQQYKLEKTLNKKPDVEIYILQHEIYSSGKDAIDGKAIYSMFNGKLFRYVEEPIKTKPGDYVRINYLNVGPNNVSTFHIVGILWDYVYWQGNPSNPMNGGQSVLSGPTDSWVIEFRMPPDEGSFLMLDHAVSAADRGAIGILKCTKDAVTPVTVTAEGIKYSEKEISEIKSKLVRTVAPFEPGSPDVDPIAIYGPETKEVTVKIIGNSFYPKTIKVAPGTTVKWINEDIFTYMEGEFAAIHNVATYEGDVPFSSPLLGHAETFSNEFKSEGDYKYLCAPHPYMRGRVIVGNPEGSYSSGSSKWLIGLSGISFIMVAAVFFMVGSMRKKYKQVKT